MKTIGSLVKRNVLLYIRDRSAVFFSLLSMIIVIGLMVVFLGNMNSDNIIDVLNEYGGIRDTVADRANAVYVVEMWTLAGILVVNAVTVTLMMLGFMVKDEEERKLASFYVAPVSKFKVALGYIIAAMLVGIMMCVLTLGIGGIYIGLTSGEFLSVLEICKVIGLIILNVFVAACMMFLIALFVHSMSAWNGMNTIIGTLIGFVGAIYLPMGMLPEGLQNVLKCLPVLHGTAMMREIFTARAVEKTFEGLPAEVVTGFNKAMGITIEMGNHQVGALWQVAFLAGCGIMTIIISVLIFRKYKIYEG